jgi:hypothetical protein
MSKSELNIKETPILFQTEMVQAILDGRKTQTMRICKDLPCLEIGKGKKCKFGQPCDLLYIKETFAHTDQLNINPQDENYGIVYRADGQPWADYEGWKWKPSIHMPKIASRIWLMIEDIRVERVQDISEQDCRAEGVSRGYWPSEESWGKYGFEDLWVLINGEESWNTNPWVWVVKFKVLSTTGRPSDADILASRLSVLASTEKEATNV